MRSPAKLAATVVGAVVALSLFGQTEAAGLVGLFGLLVAVLLLAVSSNRPKSSRKARSMNFLVRYGDPGSPASLAGVVLAALASASAIAAFDDAAPFGALVTLYVPVFLLYLMVPFAGEAIGVLGLAATLWTLRRGDECGVGASDRTLAMLLAVLVVVAAANAIVRLGLFGLPQRLSRRRAGHARILLLFGVLDTALFVIRPNGLEIWEGAPAWATPVALGLLFFIATFGSFAPELVLGLVAIAAALGQVFLAAVEADLVRATGMPCGDPALELLWAAGFVAVASAALAIRKPLRSGAGQR